MCLPGHYQEGWSRRDSVTLGRSQTTLGHKLTMVSLDYHHDILQL